MEPTKHLGIYKKNDKLFTQNPEICKGIKVYNEQLVTQDNIEYRSWNPFRSKLAAALLKGLSIDITADAQVLYLGAATGTTVSHLSDIITKGSIYAVETSPIAAINLLKVSEQRSNIIPILSDANHPERYYSIVPSVDVVYQDISQRNQADIFTRNMRTYLKPKGWGLIMVKARSIDVALKPKQAYELVCSYLQKQEFTIKKTIELSPFEKDHAAILITP
ncbi:MAG TPA: fibrillarin-like rRNA/tRNA 2'-O-methyltransferase [Candidatus Thermoplasmatota archaeon]|nr:fibrillarin-like rRNA/tRNA 2'-O-methyltransferase [Candidatus Thermoplasmatota archaeon]